MIVAVLEGVLTPETAIAVPVLMALLVAGLLWVIRVPITGVVVLSLVPWMVAGAGTHALYSLGIYDDWATIFFGPYSVYFTTFAVLGVVWGMMSTASEISTGASRDAQYVAAAGTGAAIATVGGALSASEGIDLVTASRIIVGLIGALVVAVVFVLILNFLYPKAVVNTQFLGLMIVFGQALDGIMSVVGLNLFDPPFRPGYRLGEFLVDFEADLGLPLVEYVGMGWLLVGVKVLGALVALVVFGSLMATDRFRESPQPIYVLLGIAVAYGLGPGVHRLLVLVFLSG